MSAIVSAVTPQPKSDRRMHTRRSLVDAALQVVAEKGFDRASVDDIAAKAGYSIGALYSNFAGKDELFLAVFDAHVGWFEDKLEAAVAEAMDLTPRGIRKHLDLNKPIYARTSSYGHFGRTPDAEGGFSWEKTDLADALKRAV